MNAIADGLQAYTQAQFWISVMEIIWINVLLSGDNAIVIALACRSLPPRQRLGGMIIGTAVALAMRLAFASIVSTLMLLPYVKIVGGLALLWIAVKLLTPEESDVDSTPADGLWRAVKIIALADIVMSLDNVIAVAAAANGNYALLVFGLGISVPAIVAGATLIMAALKHFPVLVWGGAALLGWIAGDVIASDPVIAEAAESNRTVTPDRLRVVCAVFGAAGVVLCARFMRMRQSEAA
jgi:YjbE family integral membrane protein